MSTLSFPYTFVSGTNADANQVNSNFASVATVANGNLEASTNVKVATPIAQTSASLLQGSALTLARSDHSHLIQCTEQRTSDPGSGNFIGRRYFNTSTLKERLCIATGGAGTWVTMGNYSSADLPTHAANHVGGGSDPLDVPAVAAIRTSNQSITTATLTTVAFNAADLYDTDTMHDTVTNNTRITFTHAGVYLIVGNVSWALNATGVRQAAIITNGGATNAVGKATESSVVSGQNPALAVAGYYKAAAADYAELQVYQNSGGSLAVLSDGSLDAAGTPITCRFSAHWVGTGV